MDKFSNSDEESQFFDAPEHIDQEPDFVSRNWNDVWISAPQSVKERRSKFIRWMELGLGEFEVESPLNTRDDSKGCFSMGDFCRIMETSGAVLRTSSIEDEFSSSRSSVSSWDIDDLGLSRGVDSSECIYGSSNCNGVGVSNVDEVVENERLGNIQFKNVSQLSPSVQQFVEAETEVNVNKPTTMKKLRSRWLSKLHSMNCMVSKIAKDGSTRSTGFAQAQGTRTRRIKVRHCRKRLKELSALFTGQDIQAHEGSIVAMKFSPDGQYLASAGEDKIVRVWQVVEEIRSDASDIPDVDSSCVYFSVNRLSELEPLTVEKDKINNFRGLRRTQDTACVIFPPKVFRIIETPLHVFQGHSGEILDLSWSTNNCLLSSSVDKTVCLWRVGVDQCLKIFKHNDFVTSIQFNPVNDDYFISGSIDGKVRIWQISDCKVVDWTETTDIVTAVSYRPDGLGGIMGSIIGTCRFFDLSDNQFQLGAQMCLTSKKKTPSKRITGFQFLPQDPSKVLVNCADSKVRIVDGMNVIGKYKGHRHAGNQIYASFTSDGKHIVSAAEDSNVYMWNYGDQGESSLLKPKAIKSFECFSSDASVAIPWPGMKPGNSEEGSKSTNSQESSTKPLPFSLSTSFSLSQDYILESASKGSTSATWPEEKLPFSSPQAVSPRMSKSQYKLFKTSYESSSNSHAWGLVIVTSGWDGRIRSFHNYGLPVSL